MNPTRKWLAAGLVALGLASFLYCAMTGRLGVQPMGVQMDAGALPPR